MNVDLFAPAWCPGRPSELPPDDWSLHLALDTLRKRGRGKSSKEVKETCAAFTAWRVIVEGSEAQNVGSLVCLVTALHVLEECGEKGTGLEAQIGSLRTWIADKYDEPPSRCTLLELERWAKRVTRRGDLIPTWLLIGRFPTPKEQQVAKDQLGVNDE